MKSVYGIFSGDVCLYVGCSINPLGRIKTFSKKHPEHRGAIRLKVFRTVWIGYAHHIEGQVIRAYKRRGQCQYNLECFGKKSQPVFDAGVCERHSEPAVPQTLHPFPAARRRPVKSTKSFADWMAELETA